jgi:magnesium transporter
MSESLSYSSVKSGLPPGSLVHVGEVHDHEHKITLINYNKATIEKAPSSRLKKFYPINQTIRLPGSSLTD